MRRKIWLEESIEEYIKNNPKMDSVDIISHFKLRADIVLDSLAQLVFEEKIMKHLALIYLKLMIALSENMS